jgi:hypothetical protein
MKKDIENVADFITDVIKEDEVVLKPVIIIAGVFILIHFGIISLSFNTIVVSNYYHILI